MIFFFFNDTATTEIYPLSLHDALPISEGGHGVRACRTVPDTAPMRAAASLALALLLAACGEEATLPVAAGTGPNPQLPPPRDRKSTRLNSSHANISYAVFCLKKKH